MKFFKKSDEKLKIQASHCKEGNVLDIGFFANPNPFLIDAYGLDLVLPEIKPDNYKQVVKCNLNKESIPFTELYFNNVIAGDVIEHLENPSYFLREVNRVLKTDGRLILSTPQANDWWVTLHNWFFRGLVNDPDEGEHLQNWTILDMVRLLKKNGFELEKLEGYYMHFPKIKIRIRVKRFPILSWQVFYIARKVSAPRREVLVKINNQKINVSQ